MIRRPNLSCPPAPIVKTRSTSTGVKGAQHLEGGPEGPPQAPLEINLLFLTPHSLNKATPISTAVRFNYFHFWGANEQLAAAMLHDLVSRVTGTIILELPADSRPLTGASGEPMAQWRCCEFLAALVAKFRPANGKLIVTAPPESAFMRHHTFKNQVILAAPHVSKAPGLGTENTTSSRTWLWRVSDENLAADIKSCKSTSAIAAILSAQDNSCDSSMGNYNTKKGGRENCHSILPPWVDMKNKNVC